MKTLSEQLKALGDETRLRLLNLLRERELCVCELFAALQLPQSTVSRHLAVLRRTGWVIDQRRGSWMYYRLTDDPTALALLVPLLQRMLDTGRGAADLEALRRAGEQGEAVDCR